ncbi:hypothetical protein ONZ43_g258 [Nemania bipapillata]|uniref:Uncharacterized protein n=1 Tax=Nemania bipapillata TaxID=110536 RepID=A0ACC2J8W6_9PEZI|nr:hypothetical protein ONZ43_g258 [Nemania bipapillata]
MRSRKWLKRRGAYGSRSIAFRPNPTYLYYAVTSRWKPRGPFRLLDLPPELRLQILHSALLDCEEQFEVLQIFLASRTLYAEAAEIFYHDILLDITERTKLPGFLTGPITPLSPRLYFHTIDLKISLENNLRDFNQLYIPLLREMAEQGNLRTLRLEIDGRFPRLNFWSDRWLELAEEFCDDEVQLLIGPETSLDYVGPAFLADQPFQTLLDFLSDPRIPEVLLYISSTDHYPFWCAFHRPHSSKLGLPCHGGSWRGKSTRLKINQKLFLPLFRHAREVETLPLLE